MAGVALGATIAGMRPIVTHVRTEFALLAIDQLVNQAANWHYMFGGRMSAPLVVRLHLRSRLGPGAAALAEPAGVVRAYTGAEGDHARDAVRREGDADCRGRGRRPGDRDRAPLAARREGRRPGGAVPRPDRQSAGWRAPGTTSQSPRRPTWCSSAACGGRPGPQRRFGRGDRPPQRTAVGRGVGAVLGRADGPTRGHRHWLDDRRLLGRGGRAPGRERHRARLAAAPRCPPDHPTPTSPALAAHYYPRAAEVAAAAAAAVGVPAPEIATAPDQPLDVPDPQFAGPPDGAGERRVPEARFDEQDVCEPPWGGVFGIHAALRSLEGCAGTPRHNGSSRWAATRRLRRAQLAAEPPRPCSRAQAGSAPSGGNPCAPPRRSSKRRRRSRRTPRPDASCRSGWHSCSSRARHGSAQTREPATRVRASRSTTAASGPERCHPRFAHETAPSSVGRFQNVLEDVERIGPVETAPSTGPLEDVVEAHLEGPAGVHTLLDVPGRRPGRSRSRSPPPPPVARAVYQTHRRTHPRARGPRPLSIFATNL